MNGHAYSVHRMELLTITDAGIHVCQFLFYD